ncbi:TatD family hydrolase [Candidatus Saccharibacteria bacterium]|nr:TatD family hydrolase [Candidatus Saccharibacteria bacterium]MBR6122066.1 TatD family hydrolase [Candidatus Saccharibacteria bacterium]
MSYLVDTHCHLHDREFFEPEQAEEMLKRAREHGVKQVICIGTSHEDSLAAKEFAAAHRNVFWTYGVHPESAGEKYEFTRDDKLVAIGEVGLDYHYPGYDRDKQIRLLEEMVQLAVDNNLPCSFHVREAFDDFFAVIKNFTFEGRLKQSVLHSFTDTAEVFYKAIEVYNLYIGINGIATFADLDFLKDGRLNAFFIHSRCLLETDAPFLTPTPNRGKINEPGNVKDVATWLAKKFEISEAEVAEWTTKNARTIFNLPNPESGAGTAAST